MKYDFATGMSTPLTFGNRNTGLCGLSDDGRKLLYQVSESRLEKRPTTLTSLYLLDLSDNSVMTLVEKEGFSAGLSSRLTGQKWLSSVRPKPTVLSDAICPTTASRACMTTSSTCSM